jgi:hypothetical protein
MLLPVTTLAPIFSKMVAGESVALPLFLGSTDSQTGFGKAGGHILSRQWNDKPNVLGDGKPLGSAIGSKGWA